MTGYQLPDGRDFEQVFESGNSNITTNYITSNQSDLGSLFRAGNSGIVTGYEILYNGVYTDLGSLFEAKLPFVAYGTYIAGTTDKDPITGYRYYYAIFTQPANPNGDSAQDSLNSGSIQFNQDGTSLTMIGIGGGGKGGNASSGESAGGGGGGAVYMKTQSYNILTNYTRNTVLVSVGWAGGQYDNYGGGETGFYYNLYSNTIFRCFGGQNGTNTGAGAGGEWIYIDANGNYITGGTGGGGGDQDNGDNCDYYDGGPSLGIPSVLIAAQPYYISNYYSGGGGGSKSNNEDNSYYGGQGAGQPISSSSTNFLTGIGGLRSGATDSSGVSIYPGQTGQGWGGGGGSGGFQKSGSNYYSGGNGKQGLAIAYAPIKT